MQAEHDAFWEDCLRADGVEVAVDTAIVKEILDVMNLDLKDILGGKWELHGRSVLMTEPPNVGSLTPILDQLRASYPLVPSKKVKTATASCKEGKAVVLIPEKTPKWWNPTVAVFIREHEFAHHRLGHVACSPEKSTKDRKVELAADCEAAKQLIAAGTEGRVLVIYMSGVFNGLKSKSTNTHPSAKERHDNLLRIDCGK